MRMWERLGTVGENSIFQMDGYFVWCGTMTKSEDGRYYLYFSFWPKGEDFYEGWVKYSKVNSQQQEEVLMTLLKIQLKLQSILQEQLYQVQWACSKQLATKLLIWLTLKASKSQLLIRKNT